MPLLLDTSVAILLRDGHEGIENRLAARSESSALSIVSRVELEGGVYKDPADTAARRQRLNRLLLGLRILSFGDAEADAYSGILASCGFSRARILDRMIAAQALVADATLITLNARDFRDISGLKLEDWSD